MTNKRSVLTIATGKKMYVDLAVNLARSFYWWNKNDGINFMLVTDQPQMIAADIAARARIISIKPGEFGHGFSSKLLLDQVAPEGQTLFIDADCLIFSDLSAVFDRFKGKPVSVVGSYIAQGEWFGDMAAICKKFGVERMPKFNGGLYYLENGEKARKVYQRARGLEQQYDGIGFVRLRGRPNDEVVMALAMQLEGMAPLPDDGTIMSDPQACPGPYQIAVIKGDRLLINPPPPDPAHQSWYPFEIVRPVIVHFLGDYTAHYPYRREAYLLNEALNDTLNWLTLPISKIMIEYPERIKLMVKAIFRPFYRRLFGFRKIKTSERI